MSNTNIFRGDAQDVNQVTTFAIGGTAAAAQVYTITINDKYVQYTAIGGDTNTTIAAALKANLAASTIPEFNEVTWSVSTTTITGTGGKILAGQPFTATSSATGTGTITQTTTTSPTGKNWWDEETNWSLGYYPEMEIAAPPVQAAASAIAGGSLANGTTYYWVITAFNHNGQTAKSNEQSLAITNPNNTATLSWAAVTGATGYKIYRSTSAGTYGATTLVTTINSGATVTYNDTGAALSAGTPPATNEALGDNVVLQYSSTDILFGINQSYGILESMDVQSTYTGRIGNAFYNGTYREYRERYLKLSPKVFSQGDVEGGGGSGRINLDHGTNAITLFIYSTGTPTLQGQPALLTKGVHASNVLNIYQGDMGSAMDAGTTASYPIVRIGSKEAPATDVRLVFGEGVTLDDIFMSGGEVHCSSNVGDLTMNDGSFYHYKNATLTLLNGEKGSYYDLSIGTKTTLHVGPGFILDASRDRRGRTYTNCYIYGGGTLLDPAQTITFTNPLHLMRCGLSGTPSGQDNGAVVDFGEDFDLQRT